MRDIPLTRIDVAHQHRHAPVRRPRRRRACACCTARSGCRTAAGQQRVALPDQQDARHSSRRRGRRRRSRPISTGNGTPDLLVEDLRVWFPGQADDVPRQAADAGRRHELHAEDDAQRQEGRRAVREDGRRATRPPSPASEPRWIHYSVCAGARCSEELVVASPTTPLEFALKTAAFVPPTFAAPGPPRVGNYVWNILEPTILGARLPGAARS